MRTERRNAADNCQRLRLEIWRKHILVQVDFVLRQSAECIVLDEWKTY